MITATEALLLLETLATSLRPPDGYLRPAGDGMPSGKALAARVLAAALTQAGVTLAEAEAAVLGYLAEPDPGSYPKPWPDAGKLLARTTAGRAALHLGSDADADAALAVFASRMRALGFAPDRDAPGRDLDADPYRADAMWAALRAVGGPRAWRSAPTPEADPVGWAALRRAWLAAYRDTRMGQRRDSHAVLITARAPALLTDRRAS